jgi:hypothetical protein
MAATALLSLLPGLISAGGSLFDRKRRRNEEQKASSGISNLTDVFKRNLEGNYMDTPEVQRILSELFKRQNEQTRGINATAATTGMTDEARIGYQGKANEATSNAIGGLAGGADIWRRSQQQAYGNSLKDLFTVGQTNRANFNQSLSNITQPLNDAIGSGISSGGFDAMTLFGGK